MKRKIITILSILLLSSPAIVLAEEPVDLPVSSVVIVEVQTGSLATGTEEFVEIYNTSDEQVDISGWRLQYRPASQVADAPWLESHTKGQVECAPQEGEETCQETIEPRMRRVFANYGIGNALPMSGGFAQTGGQVRLVKPVEGGWETVDFIGYGTAAHFEGAAAAPHAEAGQAIKRLVVEGEFIDTDNNSNDFFVDCGRPTPGVQAEPQLPLPEDSCIEEPAPETMPTPPQSEVEEQVPAPGQGQGEEPSAGSVTYLPLFITEVFPDPATPQQDSTHEFVEIFNPNAVAVEVEDYMLQTGNNFQYKVTLGALVLAPQAYALVSSGDSALSLSNSGTAVRLLDPAGEVRDESPNYGKATSGQSWIKTDSGWQWSTTPSPAAANIVAAPAPKTTAVKAKTASAKAPVKTVATADQAVAPAAVETQVTEPPMEPPAPNFWVLGLVAALAVGYGLFEYRQEIGRVFSSRLAQLRGKSSGAEG